MSWTRRSFTSPRHFRHWNRTKSERDYTVCPSRASSRGRGGRRREGGLHPTPRCYNSLGGFSVGLPSPQHTLLCRSGLVHSATRAALPLCTVHVPTTYTRLSSLRCCAPSNGCQKKSLLSSNQISLHLFSKTFDIDQQFIKLHYCSKYHGQMWIERNSYCTSFSAPVNSC